jgi:hypothetical protein
MKARPQLLTLFSLLLGAALFWFIIKQTGWQEVLARLRAIGPGFSLILLVSALRPPLRALAWLRCMNPHDRHVGFAAVWRARLIGDAVGNLTTAGPLLAEPARLVFLSYFLSACVVMLLGVALLLATFALHSSLRAASLLLVALLLLGLATAFIIFSRRWSLVTILRFVSARVIALHRFNQPFSQAIERQLRRLHKLEKHSLGFYRHHPRDFVRVCLCEAGFHAAGVLEIWLTLRLIGAQTGWLTVFIFEAVNRIINVAFAFVPVKLGVDEAGTGLLAEALGLGALTGVTLALYRKLRVLFWTAIGLALLAWQYLRRENYQLDRQPS